jgi:hypothetical protein
VLALSLGTAEQFEIEHRSNYGSRGTGIKP